MALSFSLLLTLAYALLDPLSKRIRAAEVRALHYSLPPNPSPGSVTAARSLLARGWPSLVASELWLLLLLASLVVIFSIWWLAFLLPVAGLLLSAIVHRLDPYPRTLGGYLRPMIRQLRGAHGKAESEGDEPRAARAQRLVEALERLEAEAGGDPVFS
jgi:hypothetical protein